MKNNYPIDDEVEELERALIELHDRKRRLEIATRRLDVMEVILLVAVSITLGVFVGIQL